MDIKEIQRLASQFRRGADGAWQTTEHWIGYNDNQNSVTIWSSSFYVLFIGYSINIGIDPIGLFEDLDAI